MTKDRVRVRACDRGDDFFAINSSFRHCFCQGYSSCFHYAIEQDYFWGPCFFAYAIDLAIWITLALALLIIQPQTQFVGVYMNDPVCLSVHKPCPGCNFLTLWQIGIIFHAIVVHNPRLCHDHMTQDRISKVKVTLHTYHSTLMFNLDNISQLLSMRSYHQAQCHNVHSHNIM